MKWTKEYRKEYNKEYQKEYRLKNIEHLKKYDKQYYLKNKEQKKEYDKEYWLKNLEKLKERGKEYRLKNPGYQEEYRFKNKEKLKEHRLNNIEHTRIRERNRYQTDINFRLLKICRSRVYQALKGFSKSASTMKLIGCTSDELRRHIESKFEPWMTWENQGLWDIDHIKACAKFNLIYPEQQCACFNWSNLQPMEHIANIKKGAR